MNRNPVSVSPSPSRLSFRPDSRQSSTKIQRFDLSSTRRGESSRPSKKTVSEVSPTPSRLSLRPDSRQSIKSSSRIQRFDLPSTRREESSSRPSTLSSFTRPPTGSFVPPNLRQTVSYRPGTTSVDTIRPNTFYTDQNRSRSSLKRKI